MALGVTPTTSTSQSRRSSSPSTVASQSSAPAWNRRECTMTARATSSSHRTGVVSGRPLSSVSAGFATSRGNRPLRRSRAPSSASGTDHAPVAAAARARLRRRVPLRRRTPTQCWTSSTLTRRSCSARISMAVAASSSGAWAAASTSARGRHASRKGPWAMSRSSVRAVARTVTQPMRRLRAGNGTITCTGATGPGGMSPRRIAAVVPLSHDSGPAASSAATRRWPSLGSPGAISSTPGSSARHRRPALQRIIAGGTPPSTSCRRASTPHCSSASEARWSGSSITTACCRRPGPGPAHPQGPDTALGSNSPARASTGRSTGGRRRQGSTTCELICQLMRAEVRRCWR